MVDVQKLSKMSATGSDRARFLVLGVLLILVVGAFLFTRSTGLDGATRQAEEANILPAEAENAPPAAHVDPAQLASVQDSTQNERAVLEHDAYLHLLMEAGKTVPGDFRRMGSRRLDAEVGAALRADPAAHRGEVFWVKAMLTALFSRPASFDLDDLRTDTPKLPCWMAVAEDQDGRQYSFATLTEPRNVSVGQVVRLEGLFLKRHDLFVPDTEGGPDLAVEDTLLLVGKDLPASFFHMTPVRQLDLALLSTVRDYDMQDRMVLDENVLFHALSFLQNVDPDKLADAGQDVTSAALLKRHEEYRGLPVRVLGTFVDSWKRELGPAGENPLDLDSVTHGLLVHTGPRFTYLISAEPPPAWLKRDTNVIVEGIFLQRYVYEARSGEVQDSPLILVKRYVPFEYDVGSIEKFPLFIILGITLIFLFWLILSMRGDRKATEEFRKRYFRNKRRQVQERFGQPPRTDEQAPLSGAGR